MRQVFFSAIIVVILVFSFFTKWYDVLIFSLLLNIIGMVVYKIGKGIVLLETTAVLYVFTCLFMPLIGYRYYTYDDSMARLWARYMPVNEDIYFQYAFPAITLFCLAITLPSFRGLSDSEHQIKNKIAAIKKQLTTSGSRGLQIMLIGVVVSFLAKFLPAAINYFAILFFFGSFAGLLYVYFSPRIRYKKAIMLLFVIFIMGNAIQSGMFTVVVYMGITIFSFFQVGKSISMLKKLSLLIVGIVFFLVLQNVKGAYRQKTWKESYEGNKVELFSGLFSDNLMKGTRLLGKEAFFPIYNRTNQGFNVALVMRRIPRVQAYDNGKRLMTVLASAFVPRFLWLDKPEAGGKFNVQYYAGFTIISWSTNVGPLGEGYGSFGPLGGVVYMFLIGLFMRWVYLKVFRLSDKTPLLICWLPVLFYETTSSAETDTLQILNSIVKGAFFVWLLVKFAPKWFGINKWEIKKRIPSNTTLPV